LVIYEHQATQKVKVILQHRIPTGTMQYMGPG